VPEIDRLGGGIDWIDLDVGERERTPERIIEAGIRTRHGDHAAVETLTSAGRTRTDMSSGENSGGLMSSAGLVRYFDAEDRNAPQIDPKTVVAFGAFFGVLVLLLNTLV